MERIKILIMGAAGRDFHNFNVCFRNDPDYEVVAFTAAQIPGIEDKIYPPELAGKHYPEGIPIFSEERLIGLIRERGIQRVVFAYSDLKYDQVMHKASTVLSAGADFWLQGPESTMIPSSKKVISVCAVRTGCGKSQTARKIAGIISGLGKRVVAIRHAMPYGNLEKQDGQMQTLEDLQEAVMEGAVKRVRPKIMTVSAIIAGLLPIMWSQGTGSEVMQRIAAPMIGGMVSSTLLTLIVTPVLYILVKQWEDFSNSDIPLMGKSNLFESNK